MKKFTKLFLSCAAVAAVTGAVATSAMAANEITASWTKPADDAATQTVTIDASGYTATTKTLLILKPGSSKTSIDPADVVAIDQNADITTVTLPTDGAKIPDGEYIVLMGGDGNVYETSFYIGEGIPVVAGDADGNGSISNSDTIKIKRYLADPEQTPLTGQAYYAVAKADSNETVSNSDAINVARFLADPEQVAATNITGTTVIYTPSAN
jgi:hypothetical protein